MELGALLLNTSFPFIRIFPGYIFPLKSTDVISLLLLFQEVKHLWSSSRRKLHSCHLRFQNENSIACPTLLPEATQQKFAEPKKTSLLIENALSSSKSLRPTPGTKKNLKVYFCPVLKELASDLGTWGWERAVKFPTADT